MGREYDGIDERLAAFLLRQPVFFVGTAPLAADGHVNVSPKGLAGTFAVLGERRVAYLDLTGSGIETVAHLRENGRIVVMFNAFSGPPRIVRLHGRGTAHQVGTEGFAELRDAFPPDLPGVRAIVDVAITRVSDSCGYAVPEMRLVGERTRLTYGLQAREDQGTLGPYQEANNRRSLDGLPGLG
ncbi:MAG TPA: pyridoxamine 5'-phosphate oxidase family protein [Acidimicrobiales bacterium]|nr:pyridoxamine 5'-phosphate oxidase family protein [Acidimicrobiales bacterium]